MFLLLWSALALAQDPCPDLAEKLQSARALFDDAELEDAKAEVAEAYEVLGCQERVIMTGELLALYRLDGLISLALADRKGATYATIRAVAADHEGGAPPPEFGPDLAAEYALWSDRLGDALIYVRVAGEGTVYVDGRSLDASELLEVASGEHLIQIETDGVVSRVEDLSEHHVVATGVPGPDPVPLPSATPEPVPVPAPTPLPEPEPAPTAKRRHPAAFFVTGLLSAGLGGGAIYLGSVQEQRFADTVYNEPVYGGCLQGQDCYNGARARKIKADAELVNALYGSGYGLCALGAGLVGAGAVGVKSRPMMIQAHWAF